MDQLQQCAELEPNPSGKDGVGVQHGLQGAVAEGSQQNVIPQEHGPDAAACGEPLEFVQELLDVQGKQCWGEDQALPSAAFDAKLVGLAGRPAQPGVLPLVDKVEDPGDHNGHPGLDLGEQDVKVTHIKRHGHVQGNHGGFGVTVEEVVDCLLHQVL